MTISARPSLTLSPPPIELENKTVSLFIPNMDGGGAEKVMLHLARGFTERGIKTDLVLAKAEGAYLSNIPDEVRVIDLNSKSPVILYKTLNLIRYLQQEQPKFLLSALDLVSASTLARNLARVPTKVVMTVQTHLSQQLRDQHQGMGKVRPHLIKWFYPWADKITATSEGVARDVSYLTGVPLKDISVIYNPVVTPELVQKAKEPLDHPWFAPGEPPVILGVGRLVYQKDFATLIKAFSLIKKQMPARLMILGEGMDREKLEDLVRELDLENEVALPGFVENPYAYMAKASVFVLSSVYEGFGNVVAEAMAVGTPVVSTDCESGPGEILENGKLGYLVPVGDFEALAYATIATLNNPVSSQVLKQRSQTFSIPRIVDRYLEVLNSISPL
ncbi:MAG TPA: glycosyltransferase [Leptolyngbyaceae cyanobacterium]